MKKILLILVILICGAFIYVKLQVNGDPNSQFNQTTRYQLGKYQFLRSLFGLSSYGAARGWYLTGSGPIDIEIVEPNDASIDDNGLKNFTADVEKYTGRSALLFNANIDTIKSGTLTVADLDEIASGHRHRAVSGDTNLFVIYCDDFVRDGQEVAKTYKEFGIVISDKRLKEVTNSDTAAMTQYLESTLLHEFGHQLGLEHNDYNSCIMNAKADRLPNEVFTGQFTPTKFCDVELQQLDAIKTSLK